MPLQLAFSKGHGTLNDFVLFLDREGTLDLTPAQVRFLCDRRAGIGGDGVLRVVRGRHISGWSGDPDLWFMDYRNADGSLAEMCGNGVRVFLKYLKREGLVPPETESVELGTRAGLRSGTYLRDGSVRVWMGHPRIDPQRVRVDVGDHAWTAQAVDVGNPHAVAILEDREDLDELDLTHQPGWTPDERFPNGVNVEFVHILGPDEVRMRVYERGVGETLSCGTGTVAVAASVMHEQGREDGRCRVHVPGGVVVVDLVGGDAWLNGPAEIVADGTVIIPDEEGAA